MPLLVAEAKNLSKTYDQAGTSIQVLNRLQFEILEGETIAVIGQSGSGKSTFLSLLSGLDRPSEGSVSWMGTNIINLNEGELARLRSLSLGIVFQQFHLMSYLTALENVSLPL